ncbi:hypothetical protein GH714_001747 [Hevea brasiliensis]|uniref:Glucosamine/galactosamine-6-phosphate isomerase domain-containing protein n=1 Tax=Hevea brasiliensis TaxID=3981 RepID=A0A6A6L9I7_HEVBR|nr:hypothetical protein GH714_001747 [Hevea brasiliensis]
MEKRDPELRLFDSSEELSSGLAEYVHQISESAIKEKGSFSLVLSGGDVQNAWGTKLTSSAFLKMVEWSKWHVFWAEENVVPILPAHVFPVSHDVPGESAASNYEFSIRQQLENEVHWSNPARMVWPIDGKLVWFVDTSAASLFLSLAKDVPPLQVPKID